jgi:collagen type VII alpha
MNKTTSLRDLPNVNGIIKGNGTSGFSAAVEGTDYQGPIALTTIGTSGTAGWDGTTLNIPDYANNVGSSGTSGQSGATGSSGSSGTSGQTGGVGSSGSSGSSGQTGAAGSSGSSGSSGQTGSSGSSGSTGTSGSSGSSGQTGAAGSSGSSGSSGQTGGTGSSGSSGSSGQTGGAGSSGSSGSSGQTGAAGSSGSSGQTGGTGSSGSSGSSGQTGGAGSSGSSGSSGQTGGAGSSGSSGQTGGSGSSGTSGTSPSAPITSTYLTVQDTRNTASTPQTNDASSGVRFDFKANSTNGLSDGGTYNGVMYFRKYGGSTDFSGGGSHEVGFSDGGNIWHRYGSSTTWGTWYKIWDTANLTNLNQLTNGPGYITSSGSISGNAATATSSTNLSGAGGSYIQCTSTGTSYQFNYQVRENSGGGSNTSEIYAPQLGFHWSGVVASSIMMEASGRIAIRNNPGSAYESFIASDITASANLTARSNTTSGTAAGVINLGGSSSDPSGLGNSGIIGLTWGLRGDSQPYYMVRSNSMTYGGYTYNRLDLSWHTGIVIGAATTYGGIRFWNNSTNIGSLIASIGDGDSNMRSTADIIAYASDKRLKENVINIPNALDKIKQINGVYFDWKDKTKELGFNPSQKNDVGVIAQEIQAILPEVVTLAPFDYELGKSKSGENYLTVKYDKLAPLFIEAIKELNQKVEDQQKIINDLLRR